MTSSDTYQLKWHSHSSHLNGSVAGLLRSERFTDVVLCTLDGSQIPAHKFILSSCSVYLSNLLEGQRAATRTGGLLYVVLPSEISTKALKILVEYMYKGETTVSNEVLDIVLKAGEVLKIRGLWRQTDDAANDAVEKTVTGAPSPALPASVSNLNSQTNLTKIDDVVVPKIAVKKDDKLLKTFNPMQPQNINRPMFIGPPKLVFIKTSEGNTGLRQIAPKGAQTILVTPDLNRVPNTDTSEKQEVSTSNEKKDGGKVKNSEDNAQPRVLRRNAERKYGKRAKVNKTSENDDKSDKNNEEVEKSAPAVTSMNIEDTKVKEEPDWDDSSIEEEERSIAEMFHTEVNIKTEPDIDIEDDLVYSPLTCELCSEVFTVPAVWVRHIEGHVLNSGTETRKRKLRSASDDTEETVVLLRCDLCQKHFPNPAQWVRHVQSTHTEVELAMSNNSDPPKRHNRFTEGVQNKTCSHCKKIFPSHASMLIHMRTHTGERPFVCGLCNKGFNVKSNLLRHLRTLHDQLITAGREDDNDDAAPAPSTSAAPDRPAIKAES